ncbi:MAG: TRAP transporter large permease subunit [Lautropia sp.]|nr:TRAP transporter large permease subunit [Lautropia sp.]
MDPVLIGEILAGSLFFGVIGILMLGFPVAYSLAGASLLVASIGWYFEVFDFSNFGALASRYIGFMSNEVLVAVPLFIFMGVLLERSGIAEALLGTMGRLFGRVRGGLGFAVIIVGALLAASTGVVGATVVTMGLISLPAMLRAGYDPKLGTGVIAASGTLGQIIPPSTILIFMGDMLAGTHAQVQMSKGNFAPTPVSVGDLFAGALFPSVVLILLYMLYMAGKALFDPKSCPAISPEEHQGRSLARDVFTALLPPLLLIIAVLGSILGGVATPTEAASVGSVGALLLIIAKRKLSVKMLRDACQSTAVITSMVFTLLLGAAVFSIVFRMLGGEELVHELLSDLPGGAMGALIIVMFVMFLLGFILDTFEVIFIIIPITAPVLLALDINPVWLGVLVGMNLQTSFMTPPFGFSLIYLRGVAPASVSTGTIYRGAAPFVLLQLIGLAAVIAFPELATWLPAQIFGNGE